MPVVLKGYDFWGECVLIHHLIIDRFQDLAEFLENVRRKNPHLMRVAIDVALPPMEAENV